MPPNPSKTINVALNPQTEKKSTCQLPRIIHHFGCFHGHESTNSTAQSTFKPLGTKPVRRELALPKRHDRPAQPNQSAFLSSHPPNPPTARQHSTAPKQNLPVFSCLCTRLNSQFHHPPRQRAPTIPAQAAKPKPGTSEHEAVCGSSCQLPGYSQAKEGRKRAD